MPKKLNTGKIEELGQFDYALIADVAEVVEKQLTIPRVVQAKPEKFCDSCGVKFKEL